MNEENECTQSILHNIRYKLELNSKITPEIYKANHMLYNL